MVFATAQPLFTSPMRALSCTTASVSDGTAWSQIEPYTCSKKTFSPNMKTGLSN